MKQALRTTFAVLTMALLLAPATIAQVTITVAPGTSVYWPLDNATINIDVANVTDFFGVSADLAYPDALVTFNDGSLAAGAFLDDGSTLILENDNGAGTLSWSVTRTGASGADGSGTAATMTFALPDLATPGPVNFSQTDLSAVDSNGDQITFDANNAGAFEIGGVWPGDTDSNCAVEAADLLPLGASFGNTGPARAAYDVTWAAKPFTPWGGSSGSPDFIDSFTDADGDGEIDEGDVLPIGVNFGETRAEATGCTAGAPKSSRLFTWSLPPIPVGTSVMLELSLAVPMADLLGTAFKLATDPTAVKIQGVEAGHFLDNGDLMALVRLDAQTGAGQAAFTRKGTQSALQGAGDLATITLTVLRQEATELTLSEVKLSTVSGGIFHADTEVTLGETTTTAKEPASDLPDAFTLHGAYPNPFNPTTTVRFDLPETATVRMVVYDLLGRIAQTVSLGQLSAGANRQAAFHADGLASGTYLFRLEAHGASTLLTQTGRFVLLK